MNRFFVEAQNLSRDRFRITGSDVRHINRVLRLRPGDRIVVVTSEGKEWEARVERLDNQQVAGTLVQDISIAREARLKITLIQGLPKAGKMDDIIQKGTEVGMVCFIPLSSERAVVRLDEDKGQQKTERWQKIAEEAAKQARRTVIPLVTLPATLSEVLESRENGCLDIMLWEGEQSVSLRDIWHEAAPVERIRLLVGPEGGFSPKEAEEAVASGVRTVTLGPRILRTETAGLVAASALFYAAGDLGGSE
jgi:16S rRNA (uracil1498-N3)-methyltransferase